MPNLIYHIVMDGCCEADWVPMQTNMEDAIWVKFQLNSNIFIESPFPVMKKYYLCSENIRAKYPLLRIISQFRLIILWLITKKGGRDMRVLFNQIGALIRWMPIMVHLGTI